MLDDLTDFSSVIWKHHQRLLCGGWSSGDPEPGTRQLTAFLNWAAVFGVVPVNSVTSASNVCDLKLDKDLTLSSHPPPIPSLFSLFLPFRSSCRLFLSRFLLKAWYRLVRGRSWNACLSISFGPHPFMILSSGCVCV